MNELLGREIAGLLFDADGTLLDTYDLILSSMRYTINEGCNENYSDAELPIARTTISSMMPASTPFPIPAQRSSASAPGASRWAWSPRNATN